ncbi:MAG TPA: type II secretion system F family protein, partial [Pirellulaceae bacterium]|nr:type II secretion system F family protein [Pirellulaceae bacterium]
DIDLGRRDTPANLEKINALVARRVSQGASLAQAIDGDDKVVTPSYRCLVQLGLHSGNLSAALTGSNRLAASLEDAWHAAALSFLYPAVVCCLAFLGIVGFCLFFVPVMESTYRSMQLPAGPSLTLLQSLRSTLPYWIGILPIGLLLFIGWSRIKSQPAASHGQSARLLRLVPGMSRAIFQERSANFAETLATLLEGGMPLPDALRIAADAWNDPALGEATRSLASSLNQAQILSDDSHLAAHFPPFLRWALLHSEATTGRARALRMVAGIYRDSAKRRQERMRLLAPIVVAIVLGGGVTLLYGLALFAPLVDLLQGLARP